MRPDLIGERCEIIGKLGGVIHRGQLVRWIGTTMDMLTDDGRIATANMDWVRFPPKAEQPDELREAAGSVVLGIETEYEKWHEAIPEPLKSMLDNLRKALQ